MIYFSTDEVFGPAIPNVRFTEYDRYNSTSPYSASKAAAEELCVAYSNTYNIPIYITHTMNVFGERQAIEKYIPMTIEKVKNDETITIHINKKTNTIGSRCYLHALDVGDALLFILNLKEIILPIDHKGGKCPKFNIASIEELNNLEVAKIIAEAQNKELKYDLIEPLDRPGHDFRYSISGDYLRSLGWQPKISVKERLTEVVKWTIGQEKF
jgi:dTDP-glucose 4,6-dehydratase